MGLMKSERVRGLITPKYCCCVIPSVNTGAYLVLIEQGLMGLGLGILAVASPSVVGASFPSFANYIFAVLCWIVTAVQPIGFIGVLREKTTTFRIYVWLNAVFTALALACAAALIIVSALRHENAITACQQNFFSSSANNSTSSSSGSVFGANTTQTLNDEAKTLCSPFAWADVGILGGLWLLALIFQGYMVIMTATYWRSMISDHNLYRSVYFENPEQFTMSILRSERYNPGSIYNTGNVTASTHPRDAWDSRPSTESLRDEPGGEGYRGSTYGAPGAPFGRSYSNSPLGQEVKDGAGGGEGQYEEYAEQQGYHAQAQQGGGYGYGAQQGMHAGGAGVGAAHNYEGGHRQ